MKVRESVTPLHTQEARVRVPARPPLFSVTYRARFPAIQACCFSGRLSLSIFAGKPFRLLLFSQTRQIDSATRMIQKCSKSLRTLNAMSSGRALARYAPPCTRTI
jgi:hypothetical protein